MTSGLPHKSPVMRKTPLCHDITMERCHMDSLVCDERFIEVMILSSMGLLPDT